jgi:hypothetical protein
MRFGVAFSVLLAVMGSGGGVGAAPPSLVERKGVADEDGDGLPEVMELAADGFRETVEKGYW